MPQRPPDVSAGRFLTIMRQCDCLRELRIAPYEDYGKITIAELVRQYWPWLLGAAGVILIIVVFAIRTRRLNIKLAKTIALRRQAEEQVRKERDFAESILDTAQAIILMLDTKGCIVHFNPYMEELTGYHLEEVRGKDWFSVFIPTRDNKRIREIFLRSLDDIQTYGNVNPIVTKNGQEREIEWYDKTIKDAEGSTIGLLAIGQDVTDRKQAEERIKRQQYYLEKAQELGRIGTWELDIGRNKLYWTDATCRIFGVPAGSVVNYEEFMAKIHPDDREYVDREWNAVLNGKPYDIDHRIVINGITRWVREKADVKFGKEGAAVNAIGFVQDITERKQAGQNIQKYQERLKALVFQLTVAEEKERRRIAEDLHDNVGQSLAFARMRLASAQKIVSGEGLVSVMDDITELLLQASQDTRNVIFDLSSPVMNELGLAAAIPEWLETQISNQYGLKTEFIDNSDDSDKKTLDENVRAILFRNVRELLTNVVKHAQADKVSVYLEQTNNGVKIIVQDDGVGFDSREANAGVNRKGSFGMFSIQERMKDLGGSLKVVSEPGKGCKATLTMPLGN
jgi:PAS domain S-box-containing protein